MERPRISKWTGKRRDKGLANHRKVLPSYVYLPLIACFALLFTGIAHGQFGVGLHQQWHDFHDAAGRFSVSVPPGWSYQPDMSDETVAVFFGPGDHDYFYFEIISSAGAQSPAAHALEAIAHYEAGALPNFRLLSGPVAGIISQRAASFVVYTYEGSDGVPMTEGRAIMTVGADVFSIAFADQTARFDAQVPLFNHVMDSVLVHAGGATSSDTATAAATSMGSVASAPVTGSGTAATRPETSGPVTNASAYVSPGGFYRFTVPDNWFLWEEQSTAYGDVIEPWHDLLNWPGKPITKSLFIWDYFDEWLQTGDQYDVVLAVIENVPGTQGDAVEALKNTVTGASSHIYTTATERLRLGSHPALAVKVVVRPGMTEPWSMGTPWHRDVTFFLLKQGTTLFVWAVPDELREDEQLTAAVASFQWAGR